MTSLTGRVAMKTLLMTAGVFCVVVGLSAGARAGGPLTPEIDAGSFATGLSVMAGVTLMITGRRWKRVRAVDRDGH